jgi:polyhydroxybutyrate depolymerase
VVFILAVSALTAGCGGKGLESAEPTTVAVQPDLSEVQGDRTVSVPSDVGLRPVLVHHPDSVGARAPLVVVLHGEGGSAVQARDELGWNAVADREGFVVAYPEGLNHAWNAGPTCCFPHDSGVNDIGFLNQTLSALTKQDLVDRSRVYAVGFSAGGSMAYAWECAHPGLLAGVGPVDAALLITCSVLAPVSVAAVYGGADKVVPPVDLVTPSSAAAPPGTSPPTNTPSGEGSQPSSAVAPEPGAAPPGNFLGPAGPRSGDEDQALALFRGVDMCPDQPASVIGGPPATERSWNCVATHSVSAAVVQGVGHQWPGASSPTSSPTTPAPRTSAPDTTTSAPVSDPSSSSTFDTDEWLWSHLRNARSR